jgi:imidazolonepropionase-like amidohydrolase
MADDHALTGRFAPAALEPTMSELLIQNARVFDGHRAECPTGQSVLVAGDRIQAIGPQLEAPPAATVIDAGGRTLMPGLIDCHIHAYASSLSVQLEETRGEAYRATYALRMLEHALSCGFTTVRDMAGGNLSLARAVADGLIRGPRYLYAGRALSMTGGHGDMRAQEAPPRYTSACACDGGLFSNVFGVIADGVDECLRATREELRMGAHCIKVMGSGGVVSPTDPYWMNQYREDEIRAIVQECEARRTYATAHCHPASAIRRCVEFGITRIEHGSLIDAETARFVAERGAYVTPTLVTAVALMETGRELGMPAESLRKCEFITEGMWAGLEHMRAAGVKVAFGTDLMGKLHVQQCREFLLRSRVFTPLEILRQATSVAAEALMLAGEIGCIAPGACADLILVDGDPLQDIGLLAAGGERLRLIVRGGEIVKRVP